MTVMSPSIDCFYRFPEQRISRQEALRGKDQYSSPYGRSHLIGVMDSI
jgi:hypothetical protein